MSEEIEDKSLYEQAKDEARKLYAGRDIPFLANAMREMQAKKEEHENQLKIINADLDVLRFEAIPTAMDTDGIEKIKLEGIGLIILRGEVFVSMKDKSGMFDWLKQHKLGSLIQPTVNSSTLKAFVKGRMKNGKEYGAEFLNVNPMTMAVITNKPKE